jgi:Bacterial antitoxin of type II TA system, VapB
MFIKFQDIYIDTGERSHGHREGEVARTNIQLDSVKIKRAQRVLSADTETEAIDRALDMVIAKHERNRLTIEANDRFLKSGINIKDVCGTLGK